MLAIITGTVKPAVDIEQLAVKSEKERKMQYEESLLAMIESGAFQKIVFCENSNYGEEKWQRPYALAKEKEVELEILSFQGDFEQTAIQGKGYGEGEILAYVFAHSRLIQAESFFVKITGRLKIDNIRHIAERLRWQQTYFNIPNRTRRDIYDTRIYAMPKKQFEELFLDSYHSVQDDRGIFLEMVYTGILRENRIKVKNFPGYPRIAGVSGSTGITYGYTEWKCKIKDVLSWMNFYCVRKREDE